MIESEPSLFDILKRIVIVIVSLSVLGVAVYYLYSVFVSSPAECALRTKSANPINNCIKLELADTKDERVQGLSGRTALEQNQAMLFIFDTPSRQCMWMKNMNFSIDIIWLDSDKKITKVARNISPNTYPKSFCGSTKDKYVIETAVGAVDDEQLKTGNQLNF